MQRNRAAPGVACHRAATAYTLATPAGNQGVSSSFRTLGVEGFADATIVIGHLALRVNITLLQTGVGC